jgi:integrase
MTEKIGYSEEDISRIISRLDEKDFILAGISRLVYYAFLRENEILEIKKENVQVGMIRTRSL